MSEPTPKAQRQPAKSTRELANRLADHFQLTLNARAPDYMERVTEELDRFAAAAVQRERERCLAWLSRYNDGKLPRIGLTETVLAIGRGDKR